MIVEFVLTEDNLCIGYFVCILPPDLNCCSSHETLDIRSYSCNTFPLPLENSLIDTVIYTLILIRNRLVSINFLMVRRGKQKYSNNSISSDNFKL